MKYDVCVIYDASVTVTVEAANAKEAKEKAMDEACGVSLCWSCARKIEVGDPIKTLKPYRLASGEGV